jgi:hypothetical protein
MLDILSNELGAVAEQHWHELSSYDQQFLISIDAMYRSGQSFTSAQIRYFDTVLCKLISLHKIAEKACFLDVYHK